MALPRFVRASLIVVLMTAMSLLMVEVVYRVLYAIRYRNMSYLAYGFANALSYDVTEFQGYISTCP